MYNRLFPMLLFTFLLLSVSSVSTVFAYEDGLLHGKTLYLGDSIWSINSSTTKATDGDQATYVTVGNWMAHIAATDTLWYKFTEPQSISSYQVKGGTELTLRLYNSAGTQIYAVSATADGNKKIITKTDNVYYVALTNENTRATKNVYEFDVFGAGFVDTIPPSEVNDLRATTVSTTSIDISFNNPVDIDFAGTKIYLNNVLKETLGKAKTSYSFEGLTPNTSYTIRVTTFDTNGNESTGVTINTKTKIPIVGDVTDLNAYSQYDRVKLSWQRPDSEFFHHVKIYRKKIEQQSFFDRLFGATSVAAATSSDGYTPVFETNGTYWTDLTVTPRTQYSYKVTSVNIEGKESTGVTIETTTPSEPVPKIEGLSTIKNENGDYVVTWTSPTKGTVKVLIGGKEYTVVDAAMKKVTIPKEEMKTNLFGGYEAKLLPIGSYGTEGEAVQVPNLGGEKIDFPLSFLDFLETVGSVLAWAAPLILLSLVFIFWRPFIELLRKTITKGGRVKQ
ncbi:fibronectin type III domain-containing protein [Anoxybacteroides rupiense]|uniref:fibronectin type III domain-containing protein n=1 Tax=Anoxybacteroides rupiense TaxID=311460 RepID=UPI003671D31B